MEWMTGFLRELYFLVSEMAPYLLIGFLFAGLLRAFFPADGVSRFMGRNTFGSVIRAALLGVPLPLCSCGVIPTGVSFYRSGATRAATTSFLISTPQTGVDSILATYALLGLPFAIIRPIVAFATGLLGGLASMLFQKDQHDGANLDPAQGKDPENQKNIWSRFRTVFTYGFGELVEDIVKWLIIGLLAAALLSVLIPDSFFTNYIGNPLIEMLIVLAASVPLYVCATGSIPLAAVLLMKGISPGAAMVFLMAGPATNVATMMVIGNTMGRKSLLLYMGSIMGGALLFGSLVNWLLPASWFTMHHLAGHDHGAGGSIFKMVSAILLGTVILAAIWNKWLKNLILKNKGMETASNPFYTTIRVDGMTCNHCRMTIEKNISAFEGVEEVNVDLNTGHVRIGGKGVNLESIAGRIRDLGYLFKGKID
jgi:hypothetical protein